MQHLKLLTINLEVLKQKWLGYHQQVMPILPFLYGQMMSTIQDTAIRYILQGTNTGQQSRFVSAFHGQISLPIDDSYPNYNRAQIYTALASVTNHFVDGFFADVRATNANAQAYAFRSTGSRIFFDGTGMTFTTPCNKHEYGWLCSCRSNCTCLLNGSYIISAVLCISFHLVLKGQG
jgi:hypothetical protein